VTKIVRILCWFFHLFRHTLFGRPCIWLYINILCICKTETLSSDVTSSRYVLFWRTLKWLIIRIYYINNRYILMDWFFHWKTGKLFYLGYILLWPPEFIPVIMSKTTEIGAHYLPWEYFRYAHKTPFDQYKITLRWGDNVGHWRSQVHTL